LKYEGLIEAIDGEGMTDDAALRTTETGRRELRTLLTARLRLGAAELNKLVVALKFRFLHLLPAEDQRAQADHLVEVCENELARLEPCASTTPRIRASWPPGSTTTSSRPRSAWSGSRISTPGSADPPSPRLHRPAMALTCSAATVGCSVEGGRPHASPHRACIRHRLSAAGRPGGRPGVHRHTGRHAVLPAETFIDVPADAPPT
jgi:hypothetical protein